MLVLLPTLLVLLSAAIFATIAVRARKRRDRSVVMVPSEFVGLALAVGRRMRLRMLAAVAAGVVVFAILALVPIPQLHLSLGLAIGPGLGALAACLVIAAIPLPRPVATTRVRQADLTPRDATSFGPRWGFILPLVAAAFYVVFLIATASLASTADYSKLSRQLALMTPGGYQTQSPYPGWFYAVPLLIVTVLLSAGVLFTLRRVADAPSLGALELAPLDEAIRRGATRFVMLFSSSVIVLYLAATALIAGMAERDVARWSTMNAKGLRKVAAAVPPNYEVRLLPSDFTTGTVEPQYLTGAIESVVGVVLIGFALTLFILAFVSLSVRWTAAEQAEPRDRKKVSA